MADTAVHNRRGTRAAAAGAPRRRSVRRRTGIAYLFLAPFLLLFLGFVIFPALFGLYVSFFRWNQLLPNKPWVGFQNYIDLFRSSSLYFADFWQSMGATGIFMVASVPLLVIIPLALGVLLNRKIRGGTAFRAIYFAPYVLGAAVIGVIWKYLLDPQLGVVNAVISALGGPKNIPWTVDVPWAWISLVGITIWWTMGFNTVIVLAGLKGINNDLYDAAAVDGAGAWGRFWHVTLPGLRPVMTFVTTVTILASANMFGQSYLITNGHPGTQTRTVIMYIADQGLSQNHMGMASAMSYLLFAILAVVSVVNFRMQRDRGAA